MEPPQLQGFQTLAQPRPKYRLQWEPVLNLVSPTGTMPNPINPYETFGVRYYPNGRVTATPTNVEVAYADVYLPYRSTLLGLQWYKPLSAAGGNRNQFRWVLFDYLRQLVRTPASGSTVPPANGYDWRVNPFFDYRLLSDAYALTFAREMALQKYRTWLPGPFALAQFTQEAQGLSLAVPATYPVIERVLMIQWDAS